MKLTRREFAKLTALAGAGAVLPNSVIVRRAFGQVGQGVPLPGSAIPKFVDELPNLHIVGGTPLTLSMTEFQSPVMPTGFVPATGTYGGTWVWGYRMAGQTATSYIGPVILAARGTPTAVTYVNNLGSTPTNIQAWDTSTDRTLHWADPLGEGMQMTNYSGPIPAVPHLHGGEVPPILDGGPDAWYTSDGLYSGHGYYSHGLNQGDPAPGNYAVYRYPNTQEAANIWFHDHV
ncbi:MAG: copper oxidase, partial [Gemmatimonadota bacterium]